MTRMPRLTTPNLRCMGTSASRRPINRAVELHNVPRAGYGTEVIQVRGDEGPHLANPAQLDRDANTDAAQAAGDAAEAEAEKLLKLK